MTVSAENLSGPAKVLPFAFSKVLSFVLLITLLFAENAAAACNIKLHVQVPSNTWNEFYVQFGTATAGRVPSGAVADAETGAGWYVVDLNGLNPGTPNQSFLLARTDNTTNSVIGSDRYNATTTSLIACPNDGEDYYLAEDPSNAGRTYFGKTPPASGPVVPGTGRTFYFLPPNDPEWIASVPYFWLAAGQPQRMEIDPVRCGWYKLEFGANSVPSGDAYILRSSSDFTGISTYRIGLLGMTEDPSDWTCNSSRSCFPTPFDLSRQFSEISSPSGSRNLFFVSESNEWRAADPMINESTRCSYNFAAVIYDTDSSVNSSFNAGGSAIFATGIVRPTLDENRKLVFNQAKARWTDANFRKVWNAADPSNVVRCYNMPFQRSAAGLWEFNSNQLCTRGGVVDLNGNCSQYGGYLGGFFPDELQTRGDDDYSRCETCDAKYSAQGWQALASRVNPWCYERGWNGTGTGTGNLSNAQTDADINAVMQAAGCTEKIVNAAGDNANVSGLYSGTNGNPGRRNFSFCFESHASFTYEPGQEFFFSGDDDVWVFINNRLVMDLGGVHQAVPGYVKLDTIKTPERLVEGKEYPIDIFFCERQVTQSNIRITTNMYFSQQSNLFLATKDAEVVGDVCLMRSGTGNSCEEMATGGNALDTLCGVQIRDNLKYYIANRAGTAGDPLTSVGLPNSNGIILDTSNPNCEARTDNVGSYLFCYNGIKIYESLGKVQVLEDDIVGLVGTWRVWANYVGPVVPKPPPMRIAEFTKNAKVRVVWGDLKNSVSGALIASLPPIHRSSTVAGKPVKVGFAVAAEETANSFTVAMESGGSPGQTFSLAGASFSGISLDSVALSRSNLRVFADSLAQVEYPKETLFTIPANGYLELWFTGNFEAEDDARYSINASGSTSSPPYVLDVYQPRLRFVTQTTVSATANAAAILSRTVGSKPEGKTNVREMFAWTGEQMERTLVAFDPTPSVNNPAQWVPCGIYCNFRITSKAQTYDNASVSLTDSRLMQFLSGMSIEEGISKFSFVGLASVEGNDFAYFKISGPSNLDAASARWDSLQFQEPPVPTPSLVEIYDRKGGGRGDVLLIVYNKSFRNKETGRLDMLPNKIEVFWDEERADTIAYGLGTKQNGKYVFTGNSDDNIAYWEGRKPESEGKIVLLNDSTIYIIRDNYEDSFSGDRVKTAGDGRIVSWESFEDPGTRMPATIDFAGQITDKIPAVLTSAKYIGDERDCGTPSNPCVDQLTIVISEPVKLVSEEISPEASKTAFAYILRTLRDILPADKQCIPSPTPEDPSHAACPFGIYSNQSDQPTIMKWRNSNKESPAVTGDSVVYLTFRAYRSDNNTAFTPNAGDSVRFLSGFRNVQADSLEWSNHPFEDMHGNKAHRLEWGVQIDGKNRFTTEPIRISGVDPNDLDKVKDALKKIVGDVGESFFTKDRPIELVPVLDDWTMDDVRAKYPGSVGVVFKPDISNGVLEFEAANGVKVADSDISFHARSYYHTNLGNFVVKRELTGTSNDPFYGDVPNYLKCSDAVFNIEGARSCKTSAGNANKNTGVYLAWNLKDGKGRFAGTGAFVQVYDFWWEINTNSGGKTWSSGPLNKVSKIEMFGIKRCVNTVPGSCEHKRDAK